MASETEFSSGGVVVRPGDRQLLMVKVQNLSGQHVWTFPKGHPEPGETDQEAALREVREETGWSARILRSLTDVHYSYLQGGRRRDKTVRWFVMEPIAEVGPFMEDEVLEVRWMTAPEARAVVVYESDKTLLHLVAPESADAPR